MLCIINSTYAILIEEKTGTKNHSDQLTRQRKTLEKEGIELKTEEGVKVKTFKHENIIPIYFKTHDQASYQEVMDEGYQPFLRKEFLEILHQYKGKNLILLDYQEHLQSIENKVQNYQETEITKK